ncbi:MAG TPA: ATP-binding protein [Longimicrobiales bacterium]|nr:ATP-binding protein [Longimicrobiales bacterium]
MVKPRFSPAELRGAVGGLREPLLLVDEDFRVRYLNPAAEQALGVSAGAAEGRELPTLLPGRYRRGQLTPGPGWRAERVSSGWALYGQLVEADVRWMQRMLQAEQLAAVGQLAASVAHEVGAPLTAIMVAVEQLLKRECGACPTGSHDLSIVLSQTRRIAELSRRLVDLARPGDPVLRPVDLNAVIREGFELVEKQLHRSAITTRLQLDLAIPIVRADPHQLQQVLLNLLLNAERALHAGGGSVDVTTHAQGGWAAVVVSDTGPGIEAADLPRIFLPFFSRSGGTGLGLPLARQLVHAHGGTIDVESLPGMGAKFTVRVPVAHD